MAIVGFGFTKIEIERKKQLEGKISIRNNIAIRNVEDYELSASGAKIDKDMKGMRFEFEFVSHYDPSESHISIIGEVFYLTDKKKADETIKSWKKDKKIPSDIAPGILNYALSRANVEAIALSKEVTLPPPIPMPKISVEKGEENYIG